HKHNIRDMAPEIGKHPTGIIKETPVGLVTSNRCIRRVWRRSQPHIPVQMGRWLFIWRETQALCPTSFPQPDGMNFSQHARLYDFSYPMIIISRMDLGPELENGSVFFLCLEHDLA